MEGDAGFEMDLWAAVLFLSTPSGWRATYNGPFSYGATLISIHALRVEGDGCDEKFFKDIKISIHALRVEGDPRYRKKSV